MSEIELLTYPILFKWTERNWKKIPFSVNLFLFNNKNTIPVCSTKSTCGLYSKLFYSCRDDHKSDATIRSVILKLSLTLLEAFFTIPEASFMMFILQASPTIIICDFIMFMVQSTEVFFAVKFFQSSLHRLLMEYGTVSSPPFVTAPIYLIAPKLSLANTRKLCSSVCWCTFFT